MGTMIGLQKIIVLMDHNLVMDLIMLIVSSPLVVQAVGMILQMLGIIIQDKQEA